MIPPRNTGNLLEALPREILEQILDRYENREVFEGVITRDHYPVNGEAVLKKLRLVNQAFNKMVIPRLFKKFTLFQHSGCWASLDCITRNSAIAPHVRHLIIAHIGYVKEFEDFKDWKKDSIWNLGDGHHYSQHLPEGGSLAQYDYSDDAAWPRYQRWWEAESVMRKHEYWQSAPRMAFDLLINLESIETMGVSALRTIERKLWVRPSHFGYAQRETRRFFETGLVGDQGRYEGRRLGNIPSSTHLQTTMIALRTCGRSLNKLKLHRVQELWNIREAQPGLPSLKHLVIDTRNVRRHGWSVTQSLTVSPWISNLENLEHLEIKQNPEAQGNPDLPDFLQHVKWPKLRLLEIVTIETSLANLRGFVAGHFTKLECLSITEPVMSQDDWKKFCAEFAELNCRHGGRRIHLSEHAYGFWGDLLNTQ